MKPADALADLLARVAAADGAAAMFSERELGEWPAAAVSLLKAEKLLVRGPPADAVTCPGCEEDCTMPVESAITPGGQLRAFVMCDKRDDVGRVPLATDLIEQWHCSPERLADVLARLLGIRRSEGDAAAARWTVGVLKGVKHSAHVVLGIGRGMQLSIAGHTLALADVLELGDKGLALDRRALVRCVDNPTVDGLGSVSCRPAAAKEVNATIWPNPQSMTDLRSHEVSIAFIGDKAEGLAGNNMLEIRARGVVRRVSLAELYLVDRRRGTLNQQAAVLIGLANGEALRRSQESASATMRRLRSALRTHLGLMDDPFQPYRKETGWLPSLKLMDLRGLADQRAELAAERRMVSIDYIQERGAQFASCDGTGIDDEDSADRWLRENDPDHE